MFIVSIVPLPEEKWKENTVAAFNFTEEFQFWSASGCASELNSPYFLFMDVVFSHTFDSIPYLSIHSSSKMHFMSLRSPVVILTPRFTSLARFGGKSFEAKLSLETRSGHPASLPNLDSLINSPLANPRLGRGLKTANPLAGYVLETFLKLNGYPTRTVFDWDDDGPLEQALSVDPMAVLLSTTYITDPGILAACLGQLRKLVGNLPIVVGGPGVLKQRMLMGRNAKRARAAALASFGVDEQADLLFSTRPDPRTTDAVYVTSTHGLHTLLDLLPAIEGGGNEELRRVPNLVLHDDNSGWYATEERGEPVDIDRDYTRWKLVDEMPTVIPMRTSQGCPHRCRFCDFHMLHQGVSRRSMTSIIAELTEANTRGSGLINFVDEDTFLDATRIDELTQGIMEADLDIAWGGFFRVERIDEGNIEAIVESGCRFGFCGIESADPGQLKRMNRTWDRARAERGIALATSAGIELELTLVLGFPGETEQSIANTAEFLRSLPTGGQAFPTWEIYPFLLSPNSPADAPWFRRRYNLQGRHHRWSHNTMSYREVVEHWTPVLFNQVPAMPYWHHTSDAIHWWEPERRDRAFAARQNLTAAFLSGAPDGTLQERFASLHQIFLDEERTAPPWNELLADKERQPGGTTR